MKYHLTEEQARQLQQALQGHLLEALLTLAIITGMRRNEVIRLRWQDVDLEKGELHLQETKPKQPRTLVLSGRVTEWLSQYL